MNALRRLLVAVDGSPAALAAVDCAVRLATLRGGGRVQFVSVVEDATLDVAEAALADAVAYAADAGVEATATLRDATDVVTLLLDEARSTAASALVIGLQGRAEHDDEHVLGMHARELLQRSLCPVLVTPPSPRGGHSFERILCAFDGSPAARRAFDGALAIAAERGAELHLITVVELDDVYAMQYESEGYDPGGTIGKLYDAARAQLAVLTEDASALGVGLVVRVVGGADVARSILVRALQLGCDLIVLGTHGRRGRERGLLGSTTEAVVCAARVPVLAYRELPPVRISAGVSQPARSGIRAARPAIG
jgi:nucleotide-binding universal stress UspA family protein